MHFEFATATRIIFQAGAVSQAGHLASELGTQALLVRGSSSLRGEPLETMLQAEELGPTIYSVTGEPTIDVVMQGVQQARSHGCDLVVALGGGSVLDSGKAIAALLTNGGQPLDYLEVIGKGLPLTKPAAPLIAIPTTAGTGAEVTRNAVLDSPDHQVKVSLRSPLMLPRLAIVDPQLTHSVPPDMTACTGLDAFTQVIEPFVSCRSNPLTDGLCREAIGRAARSLQRVYRDGSDAAAREDMALVSLFGGIALANAKLGAVHGFAGPFGGMFSAPHGATCAALLPHVMAMNVRALQTRQPDHPALQRYQEIAAIVTGRPAARAADGVAWVRDLCQHLQIPSLSTYGLTTTDFPALLVKSARASSMQGNPIQLTEDEATEILHRAL